MTTAYDAVVVGSGPNGLAAAIVLASAGLRTVVLERATEVGGGLRSGELTLPGFVHDVCSTVHPLAFASPLFSRLPLERYGLAAVHAPAPLVHLVNEREAVTLERSLAETAATLGVDGEAYRRLLEPLVDGFDQLAASLLGPLRWPKHPFALGRFGVSALQSLEGLARRFVTPGARGLLAGVAAHAMRPLNEAATASFALVLAVAGHAVGWPITRGGSRSVAHALAAHLGALGGELRLGEEVTSLAALPPARAYLFDVTPRQLLPIVGHELPASYRRRLRQFQYGAGVFKGDWALREPIPWREPACARAATVHLSGTLEAISAGERAVLRGKLAEHPFTLVVQPSLFDPSRAPPHQHTAWAYFHVPHGSREDLGDRLEQEIERFAPGFGDVVLARAFRNCADLERDNPNYVGGDINGGSATLSQLFFRPVARADPYSTPNPHLFLCSSSTPPGGGVHGMCGYFAARSALKRVFQRRVPEELDIDVD
jgi:phytoene dehydrogenase-like protein